VRVWGLNVQLWGDSSEESCGVTAGVAGVVDGGGGRCGVTSQGYVWGQVGVS
jgi:hypothetical protein